MSDVTQSPLTPPLPNSPEARGPDGTLLSNLPTSTPAIEGQAPVISSTDPEPKPAEPTGAPEVYTEFTAPEGHVLSKDLVDAVQPIFKELGLNQAQAQKLVDFYSQNSIEQSAKITGEINRVREGWVAEVNANPNLGPKLDSIKVDLGKALDTLEPKLRKDFAFAMDFTGAGDNPAFIEVFHKFAQKVIEGKPVMGSGPSPLGQVAPGASTKPSMAKALFPGLPSSS